MVYLLVLFFVPSLKNLCGRKKTALRRFRRKASEKFRLLLTPERAGSTPSNLSVLAVFGFSTIYIVPFPHAFVKRFYGIARIFT
jgi:hypothetical protein